MIKEVSDMAFHETSERGFQVLHSPPPATNGMNDSSYKVIYFPNINKEDDAHCDDDVCGGLCGARYCADCGYWYDSGEGIFHPGLTWVDSSYNGYMTREWHNNGECEAFLYDQEKIKT